MKASLEEIVANKRLEVEKRKARVSSDVLHQQAVSRRTRTRLPEVLALPGVRLIAEIKPRSPSAGVLSADLDVGATAAAYARHASAISVLTDEKYFGGSMQVLQDVAATAPCPVLCKEFVIDPVQVFDACLAGAEAILLIVKILDEQTLAHLAECAREVGLCAVVEVQNEKELDMALTVTPQVILINNRDLATYEIDLMTTKRLAARVPSGMPVISASGIESRSDVETLLPYTNKFLVGSALMRATDVESKLRELCHANC
jgi:indole-3-glycerol phosphate synthase